MIELRQIVKEYKSEDNSTVKALQGVDIVFPDKGLVVIAGSSGCGKTTLLNIIGGLDKPDSGQLFFDGIRADEKDEDWWDSFRATTVSYIYQDFNLFENLTVEDNLKLPLELKNVDDTNKKSIIDNILGELGIKDIEDKKAGKLSGGQKQRVAIGRALVNDSKIVLADEPTGNLDEENSRNVFELLKKVARDRLVVVVTHDTGIAKEYADLFFNIQYGKIKSVEKMNPDMDTNKVESKDSKECKSAEKLHRGALPLNNCLGFALEAIKKRKVRCIVSVLIFSITMMITLVIVNAVFRRDSISIVNNIDKNNEVIIPLMMDIPENYSKLTGEENINRGEEFYKVISDSIDKSQIIKLGYNMDITCDNDEDVSALAMYVTADNDKYMQYTGDFPDNENEVMLSENVAKECFGTLDVIGKNISVGEGEFVITGVLLELCNTKIDEIYSNDDDEYGLYNKLIIFNDSYLVSRSLCIPLFGLIGKNNLFYQATVENKIDVAGDDLKLVAGRLPSKDNEIVISDDRITDGILSEDEAIGYKQSLYDLSDSKYECSYWNHINLYDYVGEEVEIVGIASGTSDVYVTKNLYENIFEKYEAFYAKKYGMLYDKKTAYKDFDKLLDQDVKINDSMYSSVFDLIDGIKDFKIYLIGTMIVLFVLTLLQMISLYSYSISDNKKTIGILRTLGIDKSGVYKIYVVECVMISVISIIISSVLNCVIISSLNGFIDDELICISNYHFLNARITIMAIVTSVYILLSFLSVYIPLKKFSKKKIMDLVK